MKHHRCQMGMHKICSGQTISSGPCDCECHQKKVEPTDNITVTLTAYQWKIVAAQLMSGLSGINDMMMLLQMLGGLKADHVDKMIEGLEAAQVLHEALPDDGCLPGIISNLKIFKEMSAKLSEREGADDLTPTEAVDAAEAFLKSLTGSE